MTTVPIETYNLMQIIWAILTLIGFASTIMVVILWVVRNALRSKSGKTLDSVKRQHKQAVIAVTPGHRANLFKVSQFLPGVLQTAEFKKRISKKRKVFYEPEKTGIRLLTDDLSKSDLGDEEKKQSLALTQECLTYMLNANTDKVFLEDGIPLTLALEDKVITTGVKGIGALAFYEKLCKIKNLKTKIAVLEQSTVFQEVATYLKQLLSQVSLIDIDVIRNYFDTDWNQSDDEPQKDYHYMMGYRDGQKKEKGIEKIAIYGAIGIALAGVIGGIVFGYLKI